MTLGDGKRRVYELLDEYGDGSGVDEELEIKMAGLFDMAQKQVAQLQPIVRMWTVEREEGVTEYAMPRDFRSLRRVWADGEATGRYRWRAGKIRLPEDGAKVEVEYNATPQTLNDDTTDEYIFEVSEEAAAAIPFFVAAMTLAADMVQNGDRLMGMYNVMIGNLETGETGGTRSRQSLFRGRRHGN